MQVNKYVALAVIQKIENYIALVGGIKQKEARGNSQCAIFSMSDNALADAIASIPSTGIRLGGTVDGSKLRKRCCGCQGGISARNKNAVRRLAKRLVLDWKVRALKAAELNKVADPVSGVKVQTVGSRSVGSKNSMA